jgi:hypothetical protein
MVREMVQPRFSFQTIEEDFFVAQITWGQGPLAVTQMRPQERPLMPEETQEMLLVRFNLIQCN